MAPRKIPRSCQVEYQNAQPTRSRITRALRAQDADDCVCIEVPFYAATRRARSYKEEMRNKMVLKSGSTGFSVPRGSFGRITYPLSEKENELLNSMSSEAQGNVHADGEVPAMDPVEPDFVLGAWMAGILLQ